jgi:hypothetical protein
MKDTIPPLDAELRRLLVRTNDQRRRTGQALHHLYRTLVFWARHEATFLESVQRWSPGGAEIFRQLALTLEALEPVEPDDALRPYFGEVLEHLADDLERGDRMLVPFLRWIESRFPPLTEMMRGESDESRTYDVDLAWLLARTFAACRTAARREMVKALRDAARSLTTPS